MGVTDDTLLLTIIFNCINSERTTWLYYSKNNKLSVLVLMKVGEFASSEIILYQQSQVVKSVSHYLTRCQSGVMD